MTNPLDPVDAWVADALREVHREEELTQEDAARVLGVNGPKASSANVSPADAVRILGGTSDDQLAAAQPGRRSRHRDLEQARKALGADELPGAALTGAARAQYYATEWRYFLIARCHRLRDQMLIVGYLEENLNGTETELPHEITDAVSRIIDRSRTQPKEFLPPRSPQLQYLHLAMEYRKHKAQRRDE